MHIGMSVLCPFVHESPTPTQRNRTRGPMMPPTTGDPISRITSRGLVNGVCKVLEPLCIPDEPTVAPSVETVSGSTIVPSVEMTSNPATQESETTRPSPSSGSPTQPVFSSPSASSESRSMLTGIGATGNAPSVSPTPPDLTATASSGPSASASTTSTSRSMVESNTASYSSSTEIASQTPSGTMMRSFTNNRALVAAVVAVSIVSLASVITILLIYLRRSRMRKQHCITGQNILEGFTAPLPFITTPISTLSTSASSKWNSSPRVSSMSTMTDPGLRPLPPAPDDVPELFRNSGPESATSPAAAITWLRPMSSEQCPARYISPVGVLPDTTRSSRRVSAMRSSGITGEVPGIAAQYAAWGADVNATPPQHAQETDGGIRLAGGRFEELSGDSDTVNGGQSTLPPPYAEY